MEFDRVDPMVFEMKTWIGIYRKFGPENRPRLQALGIKNPILEQFCLF
jgi:hypothetical protein